MHRFRLAAFIRAFIPILFMLVTLVAPAQDVSAAAQVQQEAQITRSLVVMGRAERQADYHLLYDLMLPDARLLIPRTAFVNWWPTVAPAPPADVISIQDISFSDVTYALTVTDFGNVATVDITYADANGETVERTVNLAEVGGVWRWMPDVTPDDIPAIRAEAGYTVQYTTAYSTELYQHLDMFWAQVFSDWGLEYRPPVDMIGVRVPIAETGCGPITESQIDEIFAYYCTRDETIYYNPNARDDVIEHLGQAAWDMVISHEWGHHVQNISGFYVTKSPEIFGGNYSIEHELQADCLSGIFIQEAVALEFFDSRSLREVNAMIELAGDSAGTNWSDVTAHGTVDQRRESFFTGFDDGLRGCYLQRPAN